MPDSDRPAASDAAQPSDDDLGALAPFRHRAFTMRWSTWLIANPCLRRNDAAAGLP